VLERQAREPRIDLGGQPDGWRRVAIADGARARKFSLPHPPPDGDVGHVSDSEDVGLVEKARRRRVTSPLLLLRFVFVGFAAHVTPCADAVSENEKGSLAASNASIANLLMQGLWALQRPLIDLTRRGEEIGDRDFAASPNAPSVWFHNPSARDQLVRNKLKRRTRQERKRKNLTPAEFRPNDFAVATSLDQRHDLGGGRLHYPLVLFAVGVTVIDASDAALLVVRHAVERVTAEAQARHRRAEGPAQVVGCRPFNAELGTHLAHGVSEAIERTPTSPEDEAGAAIAEPGDQLTCWCW
jgi:hypothetical protein